MKAFGILMALVVLLGVTAGWAQTATPPTPAPPQPASPPAGTAPAPPNTPSPPVQAPGAQTPGPPTAPSRAPEVSGRVLGLTPLAAVVLGLVVLGIVVIVIMGRARRDTVVVTETRTEPPLGEASPRYESQLERERRRKAS